jgi:hypothetical protein
MRLNWRVLLQFRLFEIHGKLLNLMAVGPCSYPGMYFLREPMIRDKSQGDQCENLFAPLR